MCGWILRKSQKVENDLTCNILYKFALCTVDKVCVGDKVGAIVLLGLKILVRFCNLIFQILNNTKVKAI